MTTSIRRRQIRMEALLGLRDEVERLIEMEQQMLTLMEDARSKLESFQLHATTQPEEDDWPAYIVASVSAAYGRDVKKLCGTGRTQDLVEPRTVAVYLLRDYGLSTPQIGRLLRRDHSTILAALKRIQREPTWLRRAEHIREQLRVGQVT